jgi:hypothetical protein
MRNGNRRTDINVPPPTPSSGSRSSSGAFDQAIGIAKYAIEKLKMQNSNQRTENAINSASTEKIEDENIQKTEEEIL